MDRKTTLLQIKRQGQRYAESLPKLFSSCDVPDVEASLDQMLLFSFSKLSEVSKEPSYFNLVKVDVPPSLWVLHGTRSLIEGMVEKDSAYFADDQVEAPRYRRAQSSVFLEVGEFFQKARNLMFQEWGLEISGYRSLLRLGAIQGQSVSAEYALLSYQIESPVTSGTLHWAIPVNAVLSG